MKVCISVPGRFHGFDLARELQKHGVLACLVTSYPSYRAANFGIDRKFVISIVGTEVVIRGWQKIFGYYPNWFWLNEWYDLVAAHKLPMDADIYVLWAGFALHTIRRVRRLNPKAIIILERGSAHIEEQRRLLGLVGQGSLVSESIVEKELSEYDAVDAISVPGRFAYNTFVEKGIRKEKIFVNPYGVDLSLFSKKGTQDMSSDFTVGYVGSISKQKNIVGLVSAIRGLILKGYKVKLLVAGGIDRHSYPFDFLSQFPFVSYLGGLPQIKLPDIYKRMDVFVLNSVHDGFGMVLLQAMATGVTPIATYNSGGLDIIEEGVNGYLIPILDDLALANCIERLINSRNRNIELGLAARETVLNGFGWEDYGDRAVEFYKEIK